MKRILRWASVVVVVAAGVTSSAALANVTVTNYSLPDSDAFYTVTTEGYSYYTGPIALSTTSGSINVYCADLDHTIYPGTTYTYAYGNLTENGLGQSISQPLSNELGQIANIGKTALAHGDDDLATAAQAAIWGLEYNITPTFADPKGTIATDYTRLTKTSYKNNGGWATALIPLFEDWPEDSGATQQMVVGAAPAPAPEMSAGVSGMMLATGMVYFIVRRNRQLI